MEQTQVYPMSIVSRGGAFTGDTAIHLQKDPFEVRFISGGLVYIESLIEGRYASRYWSADGRLGIDSEFMDEPAFLLEAGYTELSCFRLISYGDAAVSPEGARHYTVVLQSDEVALSVTVHTLLDGTGVLTRWLEIENLGESAIPLYRISPFSSRFWKLGIFQLASFAKDGWACEGWLKWQELGTGKTSVEHTRGMSYWHPYFIVKNDLSGEYFAGALAHSANWSMEFFRNVHGLKAEFSTVSQAAQLVLSPGERFETPAVHIVHGSGSLDELTQRYHTHLRHFVLPEMDPAKTRRIQYLVPGDMGSVRRLDEQTVIRQIDLAAAIGAELFILDAYWWDVTMDWEPSPQRFPNGLKGISDYVKSKGMAFGLYFESEGGRGNVAQSRVYRSHPEWFFGSSHILDLSVPEAAAFMETEICAAVEKYDLDLFRLDYNCFYYGDGNYHEKGGVIENNHLRYYKNFRDIFGRIARRYPNVVLQQAAGGGARNNLCVASCFHENYLTDGLSIPRELISYAGQTLALPPDVFTILHGADGGGMNNVKAQNLDTLLRIGFTLAIPQIFVTMTAPSLAEMTPGRLEAYRKYARLYKDFIRPVLPFIRLYHHEPINDCGGAVSSAWFAAEFAAPGRDRGWALIVRMYNGAGDKYILNHGHEVTSTFAPPEIPFDLSPEYVFRPRGLCADARYRVTLDSDGSCFEMNGYELIRDGLRTRLENVGMSELILFIKI